MCLAQDMVPKPRDTWIQTPSSHDYVPRALRCMYRTARLQNKNFPETSVSFICLENGKILNLCLNPQAIGDMDEFPILAEHEWEFFLYLFYYHFSNFCLLLNFPLPHSSALQPSSARGSPHPPGQRPCRAPLPGENNPLV